MNPPFQVVTLRETDLPAAAAVLARAFHDDPLQTYTFPDAAERAALSPALFSRALRYGMLFGEVWTNAGNPAGVAIWLGPDGWDITAERAAAAGLDRLGGEIGDEAAERFLSALAAAETYHRSAVPPAHWYVMVLGVDPTAQGAGLGPALLQPVIDRANAAGQPCYLETANPANLAFYERLGFECLAEIVEPRSGLLFWTLRHDPPTSADAIV